MRISHIAIDRAHTTAKDMASYFPLAAMLRLADAGHIGSVSTGIFMVYQQISPLDIITSLMNC